MAQVMDDKRYIKKAQTLLQQGYVAYNNWELNRALLLWRKAAITDPSNEQVWIALLSVIQTDEDLKVCLQNILILNPNNQDAENRLRLLENDTQPSQPQDTPTELQVLRPIVRERLSRWFAWFMTALITLFVAIILASILIQLLV